jgi:hypothetical protein
MSGGIVQLVATGDQDAWLTGKPEISFYRANYKRYTHYANTVERQLIQGQPVAGGISTIRFEKKGDLLSYVYFTARDSSGSLVTSVDWAKVIDKVELMIGGQVIDTHDFEYMTDIEPVVGAQTFSQRYLNSSSASLNSQRAAFFPLKFFFCKDWSVSLPLIALQYHDVELRITWSTTLNSTITFGPTNYPVVSAIPQTSANVVVTSTQLQSVSNTSNLVFTQSTGPLFPGIALSSPTGNLANAAVIQSFSNISGPTQTGYSNVVVAFANAAISNICSASFQGVLNGYTPVASALTSTAGNLTIASAATSCVLTLSQITSTTGQFGIQAGQYVLGLPITGPVVVGGVGPATANPITGAPALTANQVFLTFPATPAGAITINPGVISFFQGTSQQTTTYAGLQLQCWTNYVYLDQNERDFFAKNSLDMLITQVQRVNLSNQPVQELALAQPVKFLAFPVVNYTNVYANGSQSTYSALFNLKTQVNGIDVGESKHVPQWADVQHYFHTPFGYVHNNAIAPVAVIPYCLDTSKLQPTGTLNFSRLDTYRLVVPATLPNGLLGLAGPVNYPVQYLYAVNYNILRISQGTGGLLYAN